MTVTPNEKTNRNKLFVKKTELKYKGRERLKIKDFKKIQCNPY